MKQSEVRIIGGQWRGRKLRFPAVEGLRPTPDRVRETLFNWLAPVIADAHCLDLFAGSGALGLEALSRGAASVTFVDQSPQITKYLQQLEILQTTQGDIYCTQFPFAPHVFKTNKKFDLVFLDPPFHKDLIPLCSAWLEQNDLLSSNAYIYIEAESTLAPLPTPNNWQIFRSKIAGQVGYHLLTRSPC